MADEIQESQKLQEISTTSPEAVTPSTPSDLQALEVSEAPSLSSTVENPKSHKIGQTLFRETGGGLSIEHREDSTIEGLVAFLSKPATGEDYALRIFFLPKIYDKGEKEGGVIAKQAEDLAKALRIDPVFLTESAWDSNGFFMSQTKHEENGLSIQSDISRFLIKFLKKQGDKEEDDRPEYGWLYLSFCAISLKHDDGARNTNILVCFDDCSKIRKDIEYAFEGYCWSLLSQNLLSVHDALLRQIIWQYDRALWLFRGPIREIEQGRDEFSNGLNTKIGVTIPGPNSRGVIGRYDDMHEYARHVIHSSETLQAASAVANKIIDHFERQNTSEKNDFGKSDNILNGLRFSAQFLMNLKLRADAFKERLNNEIQLSYNVVSLYQLQDTKRLLEKTQELLNQSKEILQETRDDAKDVIATVTYLSLLFVPASVATSFWGMNLIVLKEDTKSVEYTDLWKFVVSAIALIVFSVLLWASIHYLHWEPSLRSGKIIRFKRRKTNGP
ncbi:hypothetical protein F5B22DRAFT_632198 [Xylaria bambusicola]|uniref:uncharacterized protein n=1 Tax=Xylaria bambusicola TaxID=326684 RepID=UPI0020074A2E|nr:uncharacterized protein F5B22DRAFT_632198 [Xylaria bambusicola]KAI0502741.1 hypothetical protein F5B22DRAFT_632198 [Xylaria bambusicola]